MAIKSILNDILSSTLFTNDTMPGAVLQAVTPSPALIDLSRSGGGIEGSSSLALRNPKIEYLYYIAYGWVQPFILLLGIVGNTLNLCVLLNPKRNHSTHVLMRAMSLADSVVIYTLIPIIYYRHLHYLNRLTLSTDYHNETLLNSSYETLSAFENIFQYSNITPYPGLYVYNVTRFEAPEPKASFKTVQPLPIIISFVKSENASFFTSSNDLISFLIKMDPKKSYDKTKGFRWKWKLGEEPEIRFPGGWSQEYPPNIAMPLSYRDYLSRALNAEFKMATTLGNILRTRRWSTQPKTLRTRLRKNSKLIYLRIRKGSLFTTPRIRVAINGMKVGSRKLHKRNKRDKPDIRDMRGILEGMMTDSYQSDMNNPYLKVSRLLPEDVKSIDQQRPYYRDYTFDNFTINASQLLTQMRQKKQDLQSLVFWWEWWWQVQNGSTALFYRDTEHDSSDEEVAAGEDELHSSKSGDDRNDLKENDCCGHYRHDKGTETLNNLYRSNNTFFRGSFSMNCRESPGNGIIFYCRDLKILGEFNGTKQKIYKRDRHTFNLNTKFWANYRLYGLYFVVNTMFAASTFITVCMASERLITVYMPLRCKTLCNRTNTRLAVLASFALAILITLPLAWDYQVVVKRENLVRKTYLSNHTVKLAEPGIPARCIGNESFFIKRKFYDKHNASVTTPETNDFSIRLTPIKNIILAKENNRFYKGVVRLNYNFTLQLSCAYHSYQGVLKHSFQLNSSLGILSLDPLSAGNESELTFANQTKISNYSIVPNNNSPISETMINLPSVKFYKYTKRKLIKVSFAVQDTITSLSVFTSIQSYYRQHNVALDEKFLYRVCFKWFWAVLTRMIPIVFIVTANALIVTQIRKASRLRKSMVSASITEETFLNPSSSHTHSQKGDKCKSYPESVLKKKTNRISFMDATCNIEDKGKHLLGELNNQVALRDSNECKSSVWNNYNCYKKSAAKQNDKAKNGFKIDCSKWSRLINPASFSRLFSARFLQKPKSSMSANIPHAPGRERKSIFERISSSLSSGWRSTLPLTESRKARTYSCASTIYSKDDKLSKRERNLTNLLLGISILFTVSVIPQVFVMTQGYMGAKQNSYPYHIFTATANLLEIANYCLNFYLYCLCSEDYRHHLKHFFRRLYKLFFRQKTQTYPLK